MRIIHADFPVQTFGWVLVLFIWITTVANSEAHVDNKSGDTELTKNINKDSSSGGRSGLEDVRSQVRGPEAGSGNSAAKFAVADRPSNANGDKQQNVLPMATTSQPAHGANKCLTLYGNTLSVTHSVTLLRISPQLSGSPGPAAPLTFSVDSTITVLTIEINSSAPIDADILDPTGAMINKRFKREATHPHRYDPKTTPHFKLHVKRGMLPTKKTLQVALPISKLRPTRELRWPYNNQPQRQPLHLNDSLQKKRQVNEIQPGGHEINFSSVVTSPIKPNIRKRNSMLETRHDSRREDFYNTEFPVRMINQNTFQRQQDSGTYRKQKQIQRNQHSRQVFRERAHEKCLLLKKAVKLSSELPYYTKNNVTLLHNHPNLRNRNALFKHFHAGTMAAKTSSGNPRPQLHESNKFEFINQSVNGLQKNQSWNRLQVNRATNAYQINQSVSDIQLNRHVPSLQGNQSVDDLLSAVISNNHLNFEESSRQKIRKRKYLKKAGPWSKNNVYINKQLSRRRRTVSLITLEDADGSDVWQIDPPNTGTWTISILSPEPVQVAVTGISSLDFTFEFLDIRTESRLKSQPIAHDTTLVRLTLTSQSCVANVTVLNLYDDAGETISAVESKDVDVQLDDMASSGQGTALFWVQMPDVPFYMSAIGCDVTGQRFQRLSSGRVVPRMFAISFVNFRSDPLLPGTDYKFGVRLRNKGGSDVFNIVGTWDNSEYFSVKIIPNSLKVAGNQTTHLAVIVRVKPSVYFTVEGALTVTAYRVSDNVSETLTETLTGEPSIFLQDYESPTCSTTSTTGGCRPNIPCHSQHWAMSVQVIDSLTGVRSATFLNPPQKAFNRVRFRYSMTNRTARAEYGSSCCNMEATLLVSDYANNPSYCKIMAPILNPKSTTTLQYSLVASTSRNNLTSFPPIATINTTVNFLNNGQSTMRPSFIGSSSTPSRKSSTFEPHQGLTTHKPLTTLTGNTYGKPDYLQSVGQTEGTTVRVSPSRHVLGEQSTPRISPTSLTSLRRVVTEVTRSRGVTNSSAVLVQENRGSQHNVDVTQSSTLRLAAIVCGSLAGLAGLAIAVICVTFQCVVKQERNQSRRRGSNESDVTMGSSSETRSEGSFVADSWRTSRSDRSVGSSWRGFDSTSAPGGSGCSPDDGHAVVRNHKQVHLSDACKTSYTEPGRSMEVGNGEAVSPRREDSQYFAEVGNGKATSLRRDAAENLTKARKVASPKRQEVEDVIFRCVFVKKVNKTEDDASGNTPDGAGCEISKISYSPLLRSGGKTYSSMLQVQKQIEEMDHQRENLSSAVRERYDAQQLAVDTSRRPGITRYNVRGEMSATPTRLHHYGSGFSCNDIPPGSPQFKGNHVHTPSQSAEMSNALDEVQSERNLPITRHILSTNPIVPESTRNYSYFQMATSDQTEPNSHGDAPLNFRTPRESLTQHDIPGVETNEPGGPPHRTSRPAYRTKHTTGVPRRVVLTDRRSCEASIHSPEKDCSDSSVTPADFGSSRYYANCKQTPGKIGHSRQHFKASQTASEHDCHKGVWAHEALAYQDGGTRRVHKSRQPGHSTDPEFNQLEAANSSKRLKQPIAASVKRLHGMTASETESCLRSLSLQGQVCKSKTSVYDTIQSSTASEDDFRDADGSVETDDEEDEDIHRIIISSTPKTSQTPSNSRSDSPDLRYVQPGTGSRLMSDASQMALRHDLQHIRQKLLKFQSRIDHEIEEESRMSRGNSPCSFDSISQSEDS